VTTGRSSRGFVNQQISDPLDRSNYPLGMKVQRKKELTDQLADALGVQRRPLGPGSKERKILLEDVARALSLSTDGGKHALAQRIIEAVGQSWDHRCHSTGDTVTSEAFKRMLAGFYSDSREAKAGFQTQIDRLLKNPTPGIPSGTQIPTRFTVGATVFGRSAGVVAYVLSRARGICEACELPGPFPTPSGMRFLEIHHAIRLADGGPDTVQNAVALCPNCHRRAHYAPDAPAFTTELLTRLQKRNAAWGVADH
jgi:5-methylcytosine-specific restriction protein A